MRACPTCHESFAGDVTVCPKDGAQLAALEVDDTTQQGDTQELALKHTLPDASGDHGLRSGPTPAPVRPRTTPSPRSTPMGAVATAAKKTPAPVAGRTPMPGVDTLLDVVLADRYKVTRKIGEGGMGAVYEAQHLHIGKRVAVKVLLEKYAEKQDIVARLQQEARLASSIGHANIVDITDIGTTDDGRTFVVMEFLDGESLAQIIHRDGPMEPSRVIRIARQVADALAAAHEKGVIHRDVKPENIFITQRSEQDFVKVVDFGISKAMKAADSDEPESPRLTHTGMVLGTPLYMSPEQARGEDDLDHRIDIYALGIILYESITGEVPYKGANYLAIISQVLGAEAKRPRDSRPDLSVTDALEAVILKAMAKDRRRRYQSMRELERDLGKLLTGELDGAAIRSQLDDRASQPSLMRELPRERRSKWRGLMVGLASLLLVGSIAYAIAHVIKGRREAEAGKSIAALTAEPGPLKPLVIDVVAPKPVPVPAQTPVKLSIDTTPEGAAILLGNEQLARSNATIERERSHEPIVLTLRLEGYEDQALKLTPDESQRFQIALKPLKKGKGGLVHKVDPKGPKQPDPPKSDGKTTPVTETKANPYK